MDAKPDLAVPDIAGPLLAWYDAHARDLPWRAKPGTAPDPYRVWLSEVMLQQTTVATVRPRFAAWVARWPDFASLAAAADEDVMAAWAGLGYYARARNLVKTARVVAAEHGGIFPRTEAELARLPGLGAYTAAAVAAIAFGSHAVVVDANVERVVARLFAIRTPLPSARKPVCAAAAAITPMARAGDFAQAMMDLGATICTPRKPRCLLCPLREACGGYADGDAEALPVKPAKRAKPHRYGTLFWLEQTIPPPVRPELVEGRPAGSRAGRPSTGSGRTVGAGGSREILLVRRPARGLLGGMRALPTGPWGDAPPGLADAPVATDWTRLPMRIVHGFTHFDIDLALAAARIDAHQVGANDLGGEWWPVDRLGAAGLPTLFAKAVTAMEGVEW